MPTKKPPMSSTAYPALREWIMYHDLICDWQIFSGAGPAKRCLEQWRSRRTGRSCVVITWCDGAGWDVYIAAHESNAVQDTLAAATKALGLEPSAPGRNAVLEPSKTKPGCAL